MKTVFLVDDHPLVRQALAQLINQEPDLEVCGEAEEVSEALQAVAERMPDSVVVDLSLGDGIGLRLIEELSARFSHIKIFVFSMHEESLYAARCLEAGAQGYLMKTEPPENVIAALRKVISGGVSLSQEMSAHLLQRFTGKRRARRAAPIEELSNREVEIFQLIGQGLNTKQIAASLCLSVKTIESHIESIKKKMGLKTSRELLVHAVHHLKEQP